MLKTEKRPSYGFRSFISVLTKVILAFLLPQLVYRGTAKGATMQFTKLYYNTAQQTWNSAYITCQKYGALVNIYNHPMVHAVEKSVDSVGKDVFIGLHDEGGVETDDWRWSDCGPLQTDETKWNSNEPKNSDKKYCVYFHQGSYDWRLKDCGSDEEASICAETQGECYYDNHTDSVCGRDVEKKEISAENISHCQSLCDESAKKTDFCWAYEYKDGETCLLVFNHDPFVCDSVITFMKGSVLAIRKCFAFATINEEGLRHDEKDNTTVLKCDDTRGSTTIRAFSATPTTIAAATSTETTTTTPSTTSIATGQARTTAAGPKTTTAATTRTQRPIIDVFSTATATTTASNATSASATNSTTTTAKHSIAKPTAVLPLTTSFRLHVITTDLDLRSTTALFTASSEGHVSRGGDDYVQSSRGFVAFQDMSQFDVSGSKMYPNDVTALDGSNHNDYFYLASETSVTTDHRSTSITDVNHKMCSCSCDEKEDLVNTLQDLLLDRRNLSSYRRKLVSITDDRPSAKTIGASGLLLIVLSTLFVILLDVNRCSGTLYSKRSRR